jgi:cytochrome o ubiquinol oxidase operon protein cyoD
MKTPGYRRDLRNYALGLFWAVALTALAFGLVAWSPFERSTTLALVGLLALVQMVVHLRYFLHIDLSRQKREDLQLILFSALILMLMAGGTIWVLANLAERMMPMPMPG